MTPATPFDCLWARGFRYYFTPLPGCFSPFPHGTSSLSVTREYLALEGGPPGFRPRFTAAVLLRNFDRQVSALSRTGRLPSVVRGSTRLPLEPDLVTVAGPATARTRVLRPPACNAWPLTHAGFRLIPFRSPLLGESRLISFPRGTEMCQFPRLPSARLCIQRGMTPHYRCRVSPFGYPRVKACSAANRGLSQPSTPFFDS